MTAVDAFCVEEDSSLMSHISPGPVVLVLNSSLRLVLLPAKALLT